MSNLSTPPSGINFLAGLLGIVFVALKLCGIIHWSWWWVTAPFWGGAAICSIIAAIFGLVALVIILYEKVEETKRVAWLRKQEEGRHL